MALGLGCRRDPPHKRTQPDARPMLSAHFAVDVAPAEASLEHFECPIFDQDSTESCTGHGTAQLLVVAFAATADPLPWVPSQKDIYDLTRCAERAELGLPDKTPLTDSGGMPADIFTGISRDGIRKMGPPAADGRFSDVTPANVNDEPKLGELEEDGANLVVGPYRIDETAGDVIELVCQAIAAGHPVGVAAYVGPLFRSWRPGMPPIDPEPITGPGGHWFVLDSYRTLPDGSRVFRGPGSWGIGYGDAGHHEVSEAFVRAAWDLYIAVVARKAAA